MKKETTFAGWQEAAQKDVEHAFEVLQSKWWLLASPVQMWDEVVEKLQFSFILISCCLEILNSLGSSGIFPKDCLFTCIFHSL